MFDKEIILGLKGLKDKYKKFQEDERKNEISIGGCGFIVYWRSKRANGSARLDAGGWRPTNEGKSNNDSSSGGFANG